MRSKTLILTLALAALLAPTASASATEAGTDAPTEWYCGEPDELLYRECVLVATVFTTVCEYVVQDPRRCPE